MTKRALLLCAAVVIVVWYVAAACEDCDTAARHFLRELFRAFF